MVIDLKKSLLIGMLVLGAFGADPRPVLGAEIQGPLRKTLKKVAPEYPAIARAAHLRGSVKLVAVVAPNGTVTSVRTVGGNAVLAKAAEDAVKQWKFDISEKESVEPVVLTFAP